MSKYFKYDSEDKFNLKDSIDNISQLWLIKDVYENLEGTLRKLNRDSKNNKCDDEDDILDEINAKKDELRDEKDNKTHYKESRDKAYGEKHKYEQKLQKIKATEVKRLVSERATCEKKKKKLRSKIEKNTMEYENLVLELFPLCALFEPLYNSYIVVGNSFEENAIPNDVRERLLKIIQDDGKCICGLDLNEHPECLDDVKNKLKSESKENSLYREEYGYVGNILKRLRDIPKIESLKSCIDDDTEHLDLINSKLKEISGELLDSDEEKVRQYEKFFNEYKNLEEEYSEKVDLSTIRINNLITEINGLEDKSKTIKSKNKKLLEINSKIDFCHKLIDEMEDLKKGVRTQIRDKVNEKTKNQFIDIKSDEYSDVYIDDQYAVEIVESDGRIVIPDDLSDGTENLLALSFIMALHSIKGIDFPLIIDAPFEKLDTKSRVNFVNSLHEFTKDRQIIFLFTDSQYTEEVRSHMSSILLDEFKLIKTGPKKTEIKHVV